MDSACSELVLSAVVVHNRDRPQHSGWGLSNGLAAAVRWNSQNGAAVRVGGSDGALGRVQRSLTMAGESSGVSMLSDWCLERRSVGSAGRCVRMVQRCSMAVGESSGFGCPI
ncbi:hypothetical protein TorRG33x02_318570 [Trema orientale]|uniref:Uncharacterized protein n=1 Tax=Trema orientale TaxID=63057 RepID=A0A2P5BJZ0_TREOI|nr:hypothetical protein TorRG33x02_318570 [Trema orientale]